MYGQRENALMQWPWASGGALKERDADPGHAELAAALQRIGELGMENELLRAKMGQSPGPLGRRRWR